MTDIDPQASVASLVLDHPVLGELFEELDLDFCCHGETTLAAACADRGLDVETTARMLGARAASARPEHDHVYDARSAPTAELCRHIVAEHHEPLRHTLPRLAETAATVVRVHGPDDPRLAHLEDALHRLSCALLTHFDREERVLFPACVALETGEAPLEERVLLDELEDDHADVGDALRDLRALAGGYAAEQARCGTHRVLLEGLSGLERDLHLHIHEENNVLFPRVRSRLAA